ncbi:hypothetical protein [Paenarthrobacter sp. YIM B13468]|jgi:hypothetical protein|uniref:hypothetical protein n=1 Tax=Paenarthrobacter sp. YIM B13468 TaxID=3366295 RepID=UPI00366FC2DA
MNEVPEHYVMPEPPYVEGIEWIKDSEGNWKTAIPPVDLRPTAAEELDMKCSEMEYFNSWYRND